MKKILSFLCTVCIFTTSLLYYFPVNAASDPFTSGQFSTLPDSKQEKAITNLVKKVSKELKLQYVPSCDFYSDESWPEATSNTALPDVSRKQDRISFNMAILLSPAEHEAAGLTLEEYLVNTVAHECRHSYQAQHAHDDTDYGKACLDDFNTNTSFYNDHTGQAASFIELDAQSWADEYTTKYFKAATANDDPQSTLQTTQTPFRAGVWELLPADAQKEAVQKLIVLLSEKLEIDEPTLEWAKLPASTAAKYSSSTQTIIINSSLTFSGADLAYFVTHEMRHAYQYAHINDDTEYAQAIKENDAHYITSDVDFNAYLSQPMEADATSYSDEFFAEYNNATSLKIPLTYSTIEPDEAKEANITTDATEIEVVSNTVLTDMVETTSMVSKQQLETLRQTKLQYNSQKIVNDCAAQVTDIINDTLAPAQKIFSTTITDTEIARASHAQTSLLTIGTGLIVICVIAAIVLLIIVLYMASRHPAVKHLIYNRKQLKRRMELMNIAMANSAEQCIMISNRPAKPKLIYSHIKNPRTHS